MVDYASVLVLVSKIPEQGVTKTRLQGSIGAENAFNISNAMLHDIVSYLSREVICLLLLLPSLIPTKSYHQPLN